MSGAPGRRARHERIPLGRARHCASRGTWPRDACSQLEYVPGPGVVALTSLEGGPRAPSWPHSRLRALERFPTPSRRVSGDASGGGGDEERDGLSPLSHLCQWVLVFSTPQGTAVTCVWCCRGGWQGTCWDTAHGTGLPCWHTPWRGGPLLRGLFRAFHLGPPRSAASSTALGVSQLPGIVGAPLFPSSFGGPPLLSQTTDSEDKDCLHPPHP